MSEITDEIFSSDDDPIAEKTETENPPQSNENLPSEDNSESEESFITSINPDNFNNFTYSKKSHFKLFQKNNYDKLFYGNEIGPEGYNIKTYQNLLIFSFITQNIPGGLKILEISSADNVVHDHFKYRYEYWRLEEPSDLTKDPDITGRSGVRITNEVKGEVMSSLPRDYFDFVFSTSAFDDLPEDNSLFKNILKNIIYLIRPGGFSMHCFAAPIVEKEHFFYHSLLNYFNNNVTPLFYNVRRFLRFPVRVKVISDPDLHYINEEFKRATEYKFGDYLNTASYNFMWKKNPVELTDVSESKIKDFLEKKPAYIYHHLMKCGGTSVTLALQDWFNLELDHIDVEDHKIEINRFLKYKFNLENIISETCIISHFHFDGIFLHQRYPEALRPDSRFKIFTFVRDPFNIVISLYYYERKRGGFPDISLKEFISSAKRNFLAELFPCDESNYKEVLERYFFIGIVERMQDSINKLAKLVDGKEIVVPLTNTSDKDDQLKELDQEYINDFKEKNKIDYLIYNYCLEKFNKL